MFDVFYLGTKSPRLFVHERAADSIEHAQQLSRTRYFWIVSYLADYSQWDFLWEPPPWQAHQRHAWASQWQKDSGTYLVPKSGFTDTNYHTDRIISMTADLDLWQNVESVVEFDFSWHPDFTDPPFNYEFGTQWQKTGGPRYFVHGAVDTKYVSQSGSKVQALSSGIVLIDHTDGNADQFQQPVLKRCRYFDNYKDTLTRIVGNLDPDIEFIWICSSICDYRQFDFSWHPETWQNHMLHVFASGDQKFGDTFFMHVPSFRSKIDGFELLEWYDINFVSDQRVHRYPMPLISHDHDSHVNKLLTTTWPGPLALFSNEAIDQQPPINVPLWRSSIAPIVPLTRSGEKAIVPKSAAPRVKNQLYDYKWIDRSRQDLLPSTRQDIVFISYDEPQAEENWQQICSRFIHAKRVHGVEGMENALKAAAEASDTAWYFAVFAKTQLAESFGFDFVPDYFQQPKHYIFHCKNMVNGLLYGHMGVVMYNRRLVLDADDYDTLDLDYTLSFPHEVVPELSCLGSFDSSAYHTWRTAFREASKLSYFNDRSPTIENQYRLDIWTSVASGPFREWCLRGANDGVEFYHQTAGDLTALKQSFRWQWLRERFNQRYGNFS